MHIEQKPAPVGRILVQELVKKDFKEKDFQTLLLFIDSGKQERGHTHQIQPSYLEPPWAEATRS